MPADGAITVPLEEMADRAVPADEKRAHRNVVATAAIAGLGGLLFGYDTGIIASALLFVKKDFDLRSSSSAPESRWSCRPATPRSASSHRR